MFTDSDWAYLAAFFDGEGSVSINTNGSKSPRGQSENHTLNVSVGNTHPAVPVLLHEKFGGALTYQKREGNQRNYCQWTIRAVNSLPFLKGIRPFLKMKGEQVDLAIMFQESKKASSLRVSGETILWRESIREKIKELNWKERISDDCVTHQRAEAESRRTERKVKRKTHCVHGHEFTEENTIKNPTNEKWKICRICYNARARKWHQKKKNNTSSSA